MKFALLAIFILANACATADRQKVDPAVMYKKDIIIKHEGLEYVGVAVLPRRATYDIEFESPGKIDQFTFTSCHTDDTWPNQGDTSIKVDDEEAEVKYTPIKGIEDQDSCKVRVGAFEQKKMRHSEGIFDFETPNTKLPASSLCNGERYRGTVTFCQNRVDLENHLIFDRPVFYSPDPGCDLGYPDDGMTFIYYMPRGECDHLFIAADPPHDEHRLTTYGYDKIRIREK